MLDIEFLLSRQYKDILFESDVAKTDIKIIFYYFRIFDSDYVLISLYKDIYVAKIDIFIDIFHCRDNSGDLIVIIRVEELYFGNILSVRVSTLRCRIRRIDRISRISRI